MLNWWLSRARVKALCGTDCIQHVLIISCKHYALLRSMVFLFRLFTWKITGACNASHFQLHFLLEHISLTIPTVRDIKEYYCAY